MIHSSYDTYMHYTCRNNSFKTCLDLAFSSPILYITILALTIPFDLARLINYCLFYNIFCLSPSMLSFTFHF